MRAGSRVSSTVWRTYRRSALGRRSVSLWSDCTSQRFRQAPAMSRHCRPVSRWPRRQALHRLVALASLQDVPVSVTARGHLAFQHEGPHRLRIGMTTDNETTVDLGEAIRPEMAFIGGLVEATFLPQVNEWLRAGIVIEPVPWTGSYLEDITVNDEGLGVLADDEVPVPTRDKLPLWRACANGRALTEWSSRRCASIQPPRDLQ